MKVAIDPGHGLSNAVTGRFDPGARGWGLEEHRVALEYALTLNFLFRQRGVQTWLTRASDSEPAPVARRDDRANQQNCTHFISIHTNGAANPAVRGTEVFYRDEEDREFATLINRAIRSVASRTKMGPDRGVKHESLTNRGSLAVLRFDGPACLIELGFISNPLDCQYLKSREARILICSAIVDYMTAKAKV